MLKLPATPSWWYRSERTTAARLLAPVGAVYGAATALRMERVPSAFAPCPVICVGNFTAGGAGKTPIVMEIARRLIAQGLRPGLLSRGYGGRLGGPHVVRPERDGVADVGDEPLLLASVAPTVVARNRPAGAMALGLAGVDVIIMDDGLQSRVLEPSLAVAVVDASAGLGNGLCVPAGPLRAPLARQLPHVDLIIELAAGGPRGVAVASMPDIAGYQGDILQARLSGDPAVAAALQGRDVIAFSGIARPEKFFSTLSDLGAHLVDAFSFPDHHLFSDADAQALLEARAQHGRTLHAGQAGSAEESLAAAGLEPAVLAPSAAIRPDNRSAAPGPHDRDPAAPGLSAQEGPILVTTRKDAVRLASARGGSVLARLADATTVLDVTVSMSSGDAARLEAALRRAVGK